MSYCPELLPGNIYPGWARKRRHSLFYPGDERLNQLTGRIEYRNPGLTFSRQIDIYRIIHPCGC